MRALGRSAVLFLLVVFFAAAVRPAFAAQAAQTGAPVAASERAGGEANLVLPDLSTVEFRGVNDLR